MGIVTSFFRNMRGSSKPHHRQLRIRYGGAPKPTSKSPLISIGHSGNDNGDIQIDKFKPVLYVGNQKHYIKQTPKLLKDIKKQMRQKDPHLVACKKMMLSLSLYSVIAPEAINAFRSRMSKTTMSIQSLLKQMWKKKHVSSEQLAFALSQMQLMKLSTVKQSKQWFVSFCMEHEIIGERFDLNGICGLPIERLSSLDFIKIGCSLNLHPDALCILSESNVTGYRLLSIKKEDIHNRAKVLGYDKRHAEQVILLLKPLIRAAKYDHILTQQY